MPNYLPNPPDHLTRLAILAYPGASQAAVLGLAEMFDAANRFSTSGTLDVITTDGPAPAEVVVLPPAFGNEQYLAPSAPLVTWLSEHTQRGGQVASACAGAFYLAAAGLLDGRRATTHWRLGGTLQKCAPDVCLVLDEILVRDGPILTAGGLMSWTDLALELIGTHLGLSTLRAVGRHFVIDTGRREQRFYRAFSPPMDHGDRAILTVQRYMQSHFSTLPSLTVLAEAAGISSRNFLRRFKAATGLTPRAYIQALCIFEGQLLLESTSLPVAEIAHRVGYENTPAFYKAFHRRVGLTPGAYRARLRR